MCEEKQRYKTLGGYIETGLDKRAVALGAMAGGVAMLGFSEAIGGITSRWSISH